jgi:hypothetical protein
MDAMTSFIETLLEAVSRRKKRQARVELSTRVPSLRFQTAAAGWQTA